MTELEQEITKHLSDITNYYDEMINSAERTFSIEISRISTETNEKSIPKRIASARNSLYLIKDCIYYI
jgi:hypothetical protein